MEEGEYTDQAVGDKKKHDLRFSDKKGEPAPIVNIPDLLLETDRRVKYADDVEVTREDLPVPGAFLLHNVLTKEESAEYVSISEEMGYTEAPLRILNGRENDTAQQDKNLRDAHRVMWHAPPDVVEPLNQRILKHLPQKVRIRDGYHGYSTWQVHPQCINERWRFGRYHKGQYFKPHFDYGFVRSDTEKSHLTFIIYLNEDIDGGETVFFPYGKPMEWSPPNTVAEYRTIPKTGSALVFFHSGDLSPRHEGAQHRSEGKHKYIIRSDLMYTKIDDEDDPTLPGQAEVKKEKEKEEPPKKSSTCTIN